MLSFAIATWTATAQLFPLLLALAMAPLVGGRLDPGYRFGTLLLERLVASAVQRALAYGALLCWRRWRLGSASVSAH